MMKNNYIFILLCLIFLTSCSESNSELTETSQDKNTDSSLSQQLISPEEYEIDASSDTTTFISFNELKLSISRLVVYDEHRILNKVQKDTVYIFPELGETIEGQFIKIDNLNLEDLKIEQRYETSISIQNEGPHCDLTNWKHYVSPWIELKPIKEQSYQCLSYVHEDYQKFPSVNITDLKQHIKTNYDKEWYDLISNIKTIYEYPSSVGISRYYIRISGIEKSSKEFISKILIFENPMGC